MPIRASTPNAAPPPTGPQLPSRAELVAAGLGGLATLLLLVIWLRGPVTSEAAPELAPTAEAPTVEPPGDSEPAGAVSAEPRVTLSSGDASLLRLQAVKRDLERGKWVDALSGLEAICKANPHAAEDEGVYGALMELATRITLLPGTEPDRYFDLLLNDTATMGPDVLYHLWTTKGGSEAAKRSERLLARPEVRARGTPALRVAYELRAARCPEKQALFERAGKDGDGRTLGQLVMLGEECGSKNANCCYPKDAALGQAIIAIRARL
jgi:hypothetical protein